MKRSNKTVRPPGRWVRRVFYTAMPLFLVAGLYSGLRLWYCMLFLQIFILLLILAVDLWTVYTFRYNQVLSAEEAVKGEVCRIDLSIVNERPLPLTMMEIEVETVAPVDRITLQMSLAPFKILDFTVPMTLPYRGIYEVGMTKIHITDFFGLLPFVFDMRTLPYYRLPRITVFPMAEQLQNVSGVPGDHKSFSSGRLPLGESSETPVGAREYQPGDTLRRVHWVKSAQMGKLFTREYDIPRRGRMLLLVDNTVASPDSEESRILIDTLCEAAAEISLFGVTAGHEVQALSASSLPGRPDEAEASNIRTFPAIHRMLAEMAVDEKNPGKKLKEALSAISPREDGSLFVLTGNADKELVSLLRGALRQFSDVTLLQAGESFVPAEGIHTIRLTPGENVRARLEAM